MSRKVCGRNLFRCVCHVGCVDICTRKVHMNSGKKICSMHDLECNDVSNAQVDHAQLGILYICVL